MLYCIVLRQGLMSEIFSTHHVYPSPRPLLLLRILARWFFLFRAPRSTRSSAHAVVSLSLLSFDESSLSDLSSNHTQSHTHTHTDVFTHIYTCTDRRLLTPSPLHSLPLSFLSYSPRFLSTIARRPRLGRECVEERNLKPWLLASTCLYYLLSLYMKRERDSEYERGRSGRW